MDSAEIVINLIWALVAFTIGLIVWDLLGRVKKLEKNTIKINEYHKVKIDTCARCGNHNLVNGTLSTPTQPVISVFEEKTKLPVKKLKTINCLNCGSVEIYLDKNS